MFTTGNLVARSPMLFSLWHTYKLKGYHQYWAVPIYIRFYSVYMKCAEQTLYR
jgi:hypothetical protein